MSKIDITTTCPICGEDHILSLEEDRIIKYKEGANIQDAFPDITPEERELLLSGIDGVCWRKAFGPNMPHELNGYELTDDAFYQYRKHLGNRVYSLIQWDERPNDAYEVFAAEVDLNTYSDEEIEKLIRPYYDSKEALIQSYEGISDEEIDGIIAECIFELREWSGEDESWEAQTENEAKEIILEWLEIKTWEKLRERYPMPRDEMTESQEREYVNICFALYEKEGFAKTFRSNGGDYGEYHGKSFEVVERADDKNESQGVDLDVLPMWIVQFEDGEKITVYPDEIILAEIKRQGWSWE